MSFRIFDRVLARCDNAKLDSDSAYFTALMLLGEVVAKTTVLGLASALNDDTLRSRYAAISKLVRADGIGEYAQALNQIAQGPTSSLLDPSAKLELQSMVERVGPEAWQYAAISQMAIACRAVIPDTPLPHEKTVLLRWYELFAQLRNRTKGHGATLASAHQTLCIGLRDSITLIIARYPLFSRDWAFLHQNLSGKFRVSPISERAENFSPLTKRPSDPMADGIYVFFDAPRMVELISSDVELTDIFLPNGGFSTKTFELLSYETDEVRKEDSSRFLIPATDLPKSHTAGKGELTPHANVLHNLPDLPGDYVSRRELEAELEALLLDDRHPVVTLAGRGGIGKTSLALRVLNRISNEDRYLALVWFSARDIDLLPEGPKVVQPAVIDDADIAKEFWHLTSGTPRAKKEEQRAHLQLALSKDGLGGPLLFVIDNFETVRNPRELFMYLSTHVRSPNKILITTRSRDFKGDYPLEVTGMTDEETDELIDVTATRLVILDRLGSSLREAIKVEAQGHPYIVKVLVGELAAAKGSFAIRRVIGSKDHILEALFERTFAILSHAARRLFLMLSGWRSEVLEIAVIAVISSRTNESFDVARALEELEALSMIERSKSQADGNHFLGVPLAARLFGQRKLEVNPLKISVDADLELLRLFGTVNPSEVRHGYGPKLLGFFRAVSERLGKQPGWLPEAIAMLEVVAEDYPQVWLYLAELMEGTKKDFDATATYLERYIQGDRIEPNKLSQAWRDLGRVYRVLDNLPGHLNALVERARLSSTPLWECSQISSEINYLLVKEAKAELPYDETRLMVERLVQVFEEKIRSDVAQARDFSRLAWLHLKLRNERRAFELVNLGLHLEPANEYCLKLKDQEFYKRLAFGR